MTRAGCIVCGADADDEHHLTGRDASGNYLDRALVAKLCHDHHELFHDDLRTDGLDRVSRALDMIEAVAHRLRRVAVFLCRFAVHAHDFWALLAGHLRAWADQLSAAAAALGP